MAAKMEGTASYDVRFYRGGQNWPMNPFLFQGAGQVTVEPDFVTVRGNSHRSFRFSQREQHRLRMADIVNVRVEGEDVVFDVLEVQQAQVQEREVGFSAGSREAAQRIAALLPQRRTARFEVEYAERNVFHDRIDYWSPSTPVIWCLLVANVGIFFLMWFVRQGHTAINAQSLLAWGAGADAIRRSHQLITWGANYGPWTLKGQWWRLFTSMFLHGSVLHLAFNMFALWQVGRLVERIFGSLRFAGLYLLAGLAGSLASVLWNPHVNSVGASGAIFGIIGGLLAFIGRANSGVPPTVVSDLRGSILPFLLFNLSAGFVYPHTDNAAHIGGLAGGWLAGHLLARSLHVPGQHKTV